MEAIVYVRWSTEDQTIGDSKKRQTELAVKLCQARGWTIIETIVEAGKSAFHGRHRAAGGKGEGKSKHVVQYAVQEVLVVVRRVPGRRETHALHGEMCTIFRLSTTSKPLFSATSDPSQLSEGILIRVA